MMMGLELILLVVVGVIVYSFGWRQHFNQPKPDQTSQTPLETLKARYASGEITREEYEQTRRDLEG